MTGRLPEEKNRSIIRMARAAMAASSDMSQQNQNIAG
jgi:hypothetical protein